MPLVLVHDDLTRRRVDALVNAWNRNFIPHWLLVPQGVSRALRKRGGRGIFRELGRHGLLPLGGVAVTGPGALPVRWILHAAALHAYWRASERSVRLAAENALATARDLGATSVALPLLGAGTGGLAPETSLALITESWRASGDDVMLVEVVVHDERLHARLASDPGAPPAR